MNEPQETGALVLLNGNTVYRRTSGGFWACIDETNPHASNVNWAFLDHPKWTLTRLHEGDAGPVLSEEWGYTSSPERDIVMACGFREQAVAAMTKVTGRRFVDRQNIEFVAAPELRHRYYTDWLVPDDGL